MRKLVDQDGIEFTVVEQPIDPAGKHDARIKDSPNRGTGMRLAKAHRDAICHETRACGTVDPVRRRLCLATLSPNT